MGSAEIAPPAATVSLWGDRSTLTICVTQTKSRRSLGCHEPPLSRSTWRGTPTCLARSSPAAANALGCG